MSREIKFRGLVQDSPTAKPRWVYYGINSKPHVLGRAEWLAEDLQYISLNDTHGIECYEGDIIVDLEDDQVYQVVWGTDPGSYPAFDVKPYHGSDSNAFSYMITGGDGFEVIGNIYENKELLDA